MASYWGLPREEHGVSDLGETLRLARIETGKTLRQAAAAAGVSKDSISKIERGLQEPTPLTVARLARAYGREPAEFLYPKEDVAAFWLATSPGELLDLSGAASRWGEISNEEWRAEIEGADADRAKEIYDEIEAERKATFGLRRYHFQVGDEPERNAAARLGFRYLTRGSEAVRRTQNQRLIEEAESLFAAELAGTAHE